jgi:hypothetical protein
MTEDELPQAFGAAPEEDEDESLTVEETQQLAEEGVIPHDASDERVPSINYESFFNDIFLEVYDIERGLDRAMGQYTKILLQRGVDVNPSSVYQQIELIQTRLVKLTIVKRLCTAFGLIDEMDRVLDHEMTLIYNSRSPQTRPVKNSQVVAGDIDQERNDDGNDTENIRVTRV